MAKNNAWKSLKKWLASGLLAGSLLMPNVAKGNQDTILVNHKISEDRGHEISLYHYDSTTATEGYDSDLDNTYTKPPVWTWGPPK